MGFGYCFYIFGIFLKSTNLIEYKNPLIHLPFRYNDVKLKSKVIFICYNHNF